MKNKYMLIMLLMSYWCSAQNPEESNPRNTPDSSSMSSELFDIIADWQSDQNPNVTLAAYVNRNTQSELVHQEVRELVNHFNTKIANDREDRGAECACEVRYSYTSTGTSYNYQSLPFVPINTNKRKKILFVSKMNGVAHSGNLTRFIRHADNVIDDQRSDWTQIASQIICMGDSGNSCSAGSCRGDINFNVDYSSQEYVYTETSGGILVGAHAISSDVSSLTFDTTIAPLQTLFNKGVMLEKEEEATFNEAALLSLLEGLLSLTAVIAGDAFSWAALDTNMTSNIVTGLLGLYTNNGSTGGFGKNYNASYNSLSEPANSIFPGNVAILRLASTGRVFGRGWGGFKSWSKANYGSSFSMVGTTNNFICDQDILPPNENAFWVYGNVNGPISNPTLINNTISYLEFMIPGFDKQELVSIASHYDYMDYNYPVVIDNTSLKIENVAYGKCIYPYGWGDISTVKFHNWSCGGDVFAFNILDVGPELVKFKSQELGLCLAPLSAANNESMKAENCASSSAIFSIMEVAPDEFTIRNLNNGLCLYGTATNGGLIKQTTCSVSNPAMIYKYEVY